MEFQLCQELHFTKEILCYLMGSDYGEDQFDQHSMDSIMAASPTSEALERKHTHTTDYGLRVIWCSLKQAVNYQQTQCCGHDKHSYHAESFFVSLGLSNTSS